MFLPKWRIRVLQKNQAPRSDGDNTFSKYKKPDPYIIEVVLILHAWHKMERKKAVFRTHNEKEAIKVTVANFRSTPKLLFKNKIPGFATDEP